MRRYGDKKFYYNRIIIVGGKGNYDTRCSSIHVSRKIREDIGYENRGERFWSCGDK